MVGGALWAALLASLVGLDVAARRRGRVPSLGRLGAAIATRWTGRVVLVAAWLFVGVHLFARYTIAR